MDKPKCVVCGSEIQWNGFAHNQDTCWLCFKEQYLDILAKYEIQGKDRELLHYMMAIVSNRFGYEW